MALTLSVNATDPGHAYTKFWNVCVGAGRANEGLRAGWLEHLRLVKDACGFQYVRFHGLFHDDMFVYREKADGDAVYNFQYVDDLFDRMFHTGVRPFVELGFCPGDLARERGTVFWWKGHGSPPNDYAKWGELVRRTVRHWIDRYGPSEVRKWYFEVWNEPNLNAFFRGTKREYFELYKTSVNAVKGVDPLLRVGGPATSNFVPDARFAGETEDRTQHQVVFAADNLDTLDWRPVWLADFFEYCRAEALPVDFVSCHPYPTDWALDAHGRGVNSTRGVNATRTDLQLLRRMVDRSPFPHAEIHLTEWSSSPSPRDHTHDHLQAATFVVKCNVESIGLVDSLSYWTFTDVFEEGGAGDITFHGGFGMVTYGGIPKPSFHAYRMLNRLGETRLAQSPGVLATRHASSGKISILAYHYPPEIEQSVPASFDTRAVAEKTLASGRPDTLRVELDGLPIGAAVRIETLDRTHGNALTAWHDLGRPEPMTREQAAVVREAAGATDVRIARADTEGRLTVEQTVEPWAVVLIEQV